MKFMPTIAQLCHQMDNHMVLFDDKFDFNYFMVKDHENGDADAIKVKLGSDEYIITEVMAYRNGEFIVWASGANHTVEFMKAFNPFTNKE